MLRDWTKRPCSKHDQCANCEVGYGGGCQDPARGGLGYATVEPPKTTPRVTVDYQLGLSTWTLASIGRALHHAFADKVNDREARDRVSAFIAWLEHERIAILPLAGAPHVLEEKK